MTASTWSRDIAFKGGETMGREAWRQGFNVLLAGSVNLQRDPRNGRNFEYYSEDPLLTGKIGAAMVNGVESNGVGTTIKHYFGNNSETNRKRKF